MGVSLINEDPTFTQGWRTKTNTLDWWYRMVNLHV